MPTPAVNDLALRHIPTECKATTVSGSVSYSTVDGIVQRYQKVRPASSPTPPVRKGNTRSMTPWSHVWQLITVSGSTVFFNDFNLFPGWVVSEEYGRGAGWYNSVSLPVAPTTPTWIRSACEIKCLSKLLDQDVDFGVFLAEAGEFADTISSTMVRIAKEVRAFRSRRPDLWKQVVAHDRSVKSGKHRSRVNELPSQWLGMVYGWVPSLQDCYGAMAALDKRNSVRNFDAKVIGRKATTTSEVVRFGAVTGDHSLNVKLDWEHKGQVKLYFKLRNATLALMASLGLINPAVIVWEKVRYSFVVDWFVPVSGWLNSLSAAAGYDFVSGCYSETVTLRSAERSAVSGPHFSCIDGESYSTLLNGRFRRTIYSSTPVPGLYLKNPFSTVHVANALALLRNAFHR